MSRRSFFRKTILVAYFFAFLNFLPTNAHAALFNNLSNQVSYYSSFAFTKQTTNVASVYVAGLYENLDTFFKKIAKFIESGDQTRIISNVERVQLTAAQVETLRADLSQIFSQEIVRQVAAEVSRLGLTSDKIVTPSLTRVEIEKIITDKIAALQNQPSLPVDLKDYYTRTIVDNLISGLSVQIANANKLAGQMGDISQLTNTILNTPTINGATLTGTLSGDAVLSVTTLTVTGATTLARATSTSQHVTNTFTVGGNATTSSNGNFITAGSVGVGTTSPWALFSVSPNGISGPAFAIGSSTATNLVVTNGGEVKIGSGANNYTDELLSLQQNGGKIKVESVGYVTGYLGPTALSTSLFGLWTDGDLAFGTGGDVGPVGIDGTSDIGFTEQMRITSGGNVGIATSTPNNLLDIYSTSKAAVGFTGASGGTYKWTMGMDVTNGGRFSIASSTALGTNDRFVIDGSGNVGIGTTSPYAKLSVVGQTVAAYFTATTSTASTFPYASTTAISSTGGAWLATAGSSVGIGTSTPIVGVKLQVADTLDATTGTSLILTSNDAATNYKHRFIASRQGGINFGTVLDDMSAFSVQMTVTNGGFVGIGTTTPDMPLQVAANNNGGILFTDPSAGTNQKHFFISSDSGGLYFGNRTDNLATNNDYIALKAGGDIGIGTTTPNWQFQIASSSKAFLALSDMSAGVDSKHWFMSSQGGNLYIGTSTDALSATSTVFTIQGSSMQVGIGTTSPVAKLSIQGNTNASGLAFVTAANNGSTRFAITDSGKVGLGTTTPTDGIGIYNVGSLNILSVVAVGSQKNAVLRMQDLAGGYARLHFTDVDNTEDKRNFGITYNNDRLAFESMTDALGTSTVAVFIDTATGMKMGIGTTTADANLSIYQPDGNPSIEFGYAANAGTWMIGQAGGNGGQFVIASTSDVADFGNQNFVRFLIDGRGNVGLSTTTPWRTLSVNGTVGFDGLTTNLGAAAASLCLSADKEVTRNTDDETCLTSSARYKHDIQTLNAGTAIDMLKQLRPVSFEYNNIPGMRYGLIAEEVNAVNPLLVSFDKEGQPNTVRYITMVPLIIQAVQELQAQINILNSSSGSGLGGLSLESILSSLESLGMKISQGIIYVKDLEANSVKTKVLKAEQIEMLDKATGETYCTWIENGEWSKTLGVCN